MKLSNFLAEYVNRGSREITKKYGMWDWKTFRLLLGLTEYLNFECNFDKDGRCKNRQTAYHQQNERSLMNCCHGCMSCVGFHYDLPTEKGILESYAKSFDKETGFWRPGQGCVLPRDMRSPTCVTYQCGARYNPAQEALTGLIRTRNIIPLFGPVNNLFPDGFEQGALIDGSKTPQTYLPDKLEKWLKKEAKNDERRNSKKTRKRTRKVKGN